MIGSHGIPVNGIINKEIEMKETLLCLAIACLQAMPVMAADIAMMDGDETTVTIYNDNSGTSIMGFYTKDLVGNTYASKQIAVGDVDSSFANSEIICLRSDMNVFDIYNAGKTPNANGSYQTQNGFTTADPFGGIFQMSDITTGNVLTGEGSVIIGLREGGGAIDFFSADANRDDRWGA
jgi:hypothetical protein